MARRRKSSPPPIDPIGSAARQRTRARRLGPEDTCALCGEVNPAALTTAHRSLFERHHVVGQANDGELTVVVCRNCHAVLSEGQRTYGVPLREPTAFLERLYAVLRALGALFLELGPRLLTLADELQSRTKNESIQEESK